MARSFLLSIILRPCQTFLTQSVQSQGFTPVVFLDGRSEECSSEYIRELREILAKYVTEERNPENHLGVARVEVSYPSPLLQKGVVLIDTPGIGSTFRRNTEATLNFLPQCDGAIFMISADPPITQVEIEFLKAVYDKAARVFFIMNKSDYLNEEELTAAVEFFRRVLREQLHLDGNVPIFSVSARQGLEAKMQRNQSLWTSSGMSNLENYLIGFLAEEKIQTLNLAMTRKASDILENSLLRLRLKTRSLTLPLEDLEHRLAVFNQKLEEVEHQRLLAQDILKGDQKRLLETLEEECAKTNQEATTKLFQAIEEVLTTDTSIKSLEETIRNRFSKEIPEIFDKSLSAVQQLLNKRTQEVLNAHQERVNVLADVIRRTATELFKIPYAPGKGSEGLEIRREPYWVTENWSVTVNPLPRGLFERFMPRAVALRHIRKWLQQDAEAIALRNVSSLQWEMLQNINDTFYAFSIDIDKELQEIASATRGAILEAQTQRIQRADSVGEELSRLNAFEIRLLEIRKELAL